MKKIILFSFASLIATAAIAQDDFKKFRFGLKGAPNISWFKPDMKDFKSRGATLKFSYGLTTEFGLTKNYSFVTGLEVTTVGGKLSFPDSTYYYADNKMDTANLFFLKERQYSMQYIDLPVMLKMKTNEIGYLTYFGQFGFNTSFRTKGVADDKGKFFLAGGDSDRPDIKINDDTGLFRIALNVGAGAEYNIAGNTSMFFGLNYSNGFTNVLKKKSKNLLNKDGTVLEQKAVSKFVALTVGVLF